MGYIKIEVKIRNIHKPELGDVAELLVDTGSIYTILNSKRLEKLDVKPRGKRRFKTADGRIIERDVGAAEIEVKGQSTYSIVVFGKESDAEVLGVTTLEELGLQVDPVTGELKPLELLLLKLLIAPQQLNALKF
ncbi:MAG: retroviral-like aspartic protease family protein [Candidatus Bathyarchaeia archaeon]